MNLEISWRILKMLITHERQIRICFGPSVLAKPAVHFTILYLIVCRLYECYQWLQAGMSNILFSSFKASTWATTHRCRSSGSGAKSLGYILSIPKSGMENCFHECVLILVLLSSIVQFYICVHVSDDTIKILKQ